MGPRITKGAKQRKSSEVLTPRKTLCFDRFAVTHLENAPLLCIIELKIGAAPIMEMYMNASEEVRTKRGN